MCRGSEEWFASFVSEARELEFEVGEESILSVVQVQLGDGFDPAQACVKRCAMQMEFLCGKVRISGVVQVHLERLRERVALIRFPYEEFANAWVDGLGFAVVVDQCRDAPVDAHSVEIHDRAQRAQRRAHLGRAPRLVIRPGELRQVAAHTRDADPALVTRTDRPRQCLMGRLAELFERRMCRGHGDDEEAMRTAAHRQAAPAWQAQSDLLERGIDPRSHRLCVVLSPIAWARQQHQRSDGGVLLE